MARYWDPLGSHVDNVLHGISWLLRSWKDVAKECEEWLGPKAGSLALQGSTGSLGLTSPK